MRKRSGGLVQSRMRSVIRVRLLERFQGGRCKIDGLTLWKVCCCIFAVAFLVRAGLIVKLGTYRAIEYSEPVQVAETLVRTNVFGNPFSGETGPTAHLAPGHPFLLSLIYRAFGFGTGAELIKELLSSAAASLQYGMLPWLAMALGLPMSVGALAGACGASLPLFFWIETKGTWEQPDMMVLLVAALGFSAILIRQVRTSAPVGFGALWGIAFLFSPSFAPILAGVSALWLWAIRARSWRPILTTLVPILLVISPWILRNYVALGSVFWIRDNFGLEFHLSNMPGASALFDENMRGAPFRTHPLSSPAERAKIASMGEVAYYHGRLLQGTAWVRAHPREFVRLTLQRVWFFWFPKLNSPNKTILAAVLTLLGSLGLLCMARTQAYAAGILGTVWILYPLLYYVIQSDPRYRYPIHAISLLLTAYLVIHVLDLSAREAQARPMLEATDGFGP